MVCSMLRLPLYIARQDYQVVKLRPINMPFSLHIHTSSSYLPHLARRFFLARSLRGVFSCAAFFFARELFLARRFFWEPLRENFFLREGALENQFFLARTFFERANFFLARENLKFLLARREEKILMFLNIFLCFLCVFAGFLCFLFIFLKIC